MAKLSVTLLNFPPDQAVEAMVVLENCFQKARYAIMAGVLMILNKVV